MLPMANVAAGDADVLLELIRSRLVQLGIASASKKSRAHKTHSSIMPRTPGPASRDRDPSASSSAAAGANRLFNRPLRDLSMVMVTLKVDEELTLKEVLIPKILTTLCEWLRGGERLRTEGVFRKSGSAARQKQLKVALEGTENWSGVLADSAVLDVASVLKQWLRELPEPLIPLPLQKVLTE